MADFDALMEDIRDQLLWAQAHLDILSHLRPHDDAQREATWAIMDPLKGFFVPTINAHRDAFFIRTWNALDPNGKASLYELIRRLRKEPGMAPGLNIGGLSSRLARQRELHERIRLFRHARAAHHDPAVSIQEVYLPEARQLLEELQSIFNDIYYAHRKGERWSFRILEASDTEAMLDLLRQRWDARRHSTSG